MAAAPNSTAADVTWAVTAQKPSKLIVLAGCYSMPVRERLFGFDFG
jgi:hypothetical protein